MKNPLKLQFHLMFSQKFFWVLIGIMTFFVLFFAFSSFYAGKILGVYMSETGLLSLAHAIQDIVLPKIFVIILAAYFFGKEMGNRTVNIALCAGVSRFRYWLSKCIVFVIAGVIISLLYPFIMLIFGTVTNGFGTLSEMLLNVPAAISLPLYLLRTGGMYLLTLSAMSMVFCVFAALCNSMSPMVFASLGYMIGFQFLSQLLPIFLPASANVIGVLPTITANIITDPNISAARLIIIIAADIAIAAGMFAVSYLIFRKKELK
jgi:ABC-2 type transport system permease protein